LFPTVIFDIAIFILPFPVTQYFDVTVLVLICYVLDVISGIAICSVAVSEMELLFMTIPELQVVSSILFSVLQNSCRSRLALTTKGM
jgi:hypothetical protein